MSNSSLSSLSLLTTIKKISKSNLIIININYYLACIIETIVYIARNHRVDEKMMYTYPPKYLTGEHEHT